MQTVFKYIAVEIHCNLQHWWCRCCCVWRTRASCCSWAALIVLLWLRPQCSDTSIDQYCTRNSFPVRDLTLSVH